MEKLFRLVVGTNEVQAFRLVVWILNAITITGNIVFYRAISCESDFALFVFRNGEYLYERQ